MSDEELYIMVNADSADYNEVAISLAKEELTRRNNKLDSIVDAKDRIAENAKQWNREQGFRTNYLQAVIFFGFFLAIFLFITAISLMYIATSNGWKLLPIIAYGALLIGTGLFQGLVSWGLLKRKGWAWKIFMFSCVAAPFMCLIGFFTTGKPYFAGR
jgi:hypothetical protein